MLSRTRDNSGLERWRQEVGEDVADHILSEANTTGTAVHKMIESYLNNKNDHYSNAKLLPRAHFENLRPLLDKIDDIHGLEVSLYSDVLKLAGTADCIAKYDGKRSIIDFKTSRKNKIEKWIGDYFLQATAYSIMYQEHVTEEIEQIVILISSEEDQQEAFIKKPTDYKNKLSARIKQFEKDQGNYRSKRS